MSAPFVAEVMRDSLNAFLAAANKAQLHGHGIHPLYVQVGSGAAAQKVQVASVETYENPMTLQTEVVIRTE